jgi:hypothetical protein
MQFAVIVHLMQGQISCAAGNWLQFLILQEETLRLMLSITEGQNLDPSKV